MIISRDNMLPRTVPAVVYASNPQTHPVVSILQGTQVGEPVPFPGKDFNKVMPFTEHLYHCNLHSRFWVRVCMEQAGCRAEGLATSTMHCSQKKAAFFFSKVWAGCAKSGHLGLSKGWELESCSRQGWLLRSWEDSPWRWPPTSSP